MVERAVLKRVPRDSSETKHMTVIRSGRVLVNGESDSFPPYRKNRKNKKVFKEATRERYRRRYKVERTFAWIGSFRRLTVRYDHSLTIYRAFFHLACIIIVLRRL